VHTRSAPGGFLPWPTRNLGADPEGAEMMQYAR
jgi:hypothetical protein